jgi:hypothetical protein
MGAAEPEASATMGGSVVRWAVEVFEGVRDAVVEVVLTTRAEWRADDRSADRHWAILDYGAQLVCLRMTF